MGRVAGRARMTDDSGLWEGSVGLTGRTVAEQRCSY